jgi:predicted  nucleic acid-binding Zn ribbon protein
MHIAEIQFKMQDDEDDFQLHTQNLLGFWRTHGQVLGNEFPGAVINDSYHVFLMLPERDSLDHKNDSFYVQEAFERWRTANYEEPTIKVLGEEIESAEVCSCTSRSWLILYTTYISLESCLRCGDCFGSVPLYRIPSCCFVAHGELHDALMSWKSDYQACDTLQMHCSTGERFGLREMGQFDSSLSKRGRELCSVISQAMQVPTYYYLHRYYGKSVNQERARKCPSCGGEWLLAKRLHGKFDFKCDNCKLLSNVGFS